MRHTGTLWVVRTSSTLVTIVTARSIMEKIRVDGKLRRVFVAQQGRCRIPHEKRIVVGGVRDLMK